VGTPYRIIGQRLATLGVLLAATAAIVPWAAARLECQAASPSPPRDARLARSYPVGQYRIAIEPLEPGRPLRVQDNDGQVLFFEGRRALELILSGDSLAPALPALGAALRVRADSGEELDVALPTPELARDPDGKGFAMRYRLDLSRLRQPFTSVRLEGELLEAGPIAIVTRRLGLKPGEAAAARALGPVAVSVSEDPGGKEGPSLDVVCEWTAGQIGENRNWPEVAGPVSAELRAADGTPCRLRYTVSLPTTGREGASRRVRFSWRVDASPALELAITYPTVPSRRTPFALDHVVVPASAPPAFGRIGAQRMVLEGGLDAREERGAEDDAPGDAPHPLLDPARGGSVVLRLLLDGRPAGPGIIEAALAPRRGAEWGGWYWFTGITDDAGGAVLANVRPGAYRMRVRFRRSAAMQPTYFLPEQRMVVPEKGSVRPPAVDLQPGDGFLSRRPK
jgi:hypothetical protein